MEVTRVLSIYAPSCNLIGFLSGKGSYRYTDSSCVRFYLPRYVGKDVFIILLLKNDDCGPGMGCMVSNEGAA